MLSRLDNLAADGSGTTKYAQFSYLGAGTIYKVAHPAVSNNLILNYDNDSSPGTYPGLDQFGQVKDQNWTVNSATVDEYGYGYDRNGNRTYRQNSGPGVSGLNLDEKYAYDNLDRLTAFKRGTLSSGDIADANSTFQHNWTLDSLGNWATFVWDNDGGSGAGAAVTQDRSHTAANEVYGISGGSWIVPGYDAAGNMTNGPQPGNETTNLKFIYDAWNRLVQITDNASTIIVTYRYDGLNHRIQKLLGSNPASPDHTYDYYYNENWQVLEERTPLSHSALGPQRGGIDPPRV